MSSRGREGPEGYPGLDDLALVADVVGGAIALSVGEAFLVVGDEGISMHIVYVSAVDGAGHCSGHFELYQSYLRTPSVFHADPVLEEASDLTSLILFSRPATVTPRRLPHLWFRLRCSVRP